MTTPFDLVLLRGWMRDSRHWESFPDLLGAALAGAGLTANLQLPDLPGNGRRNREHTPASITALATSLRAEFPQRQGRGPLILVGLSMGGMIAAEWARQDPQAVRGICLLNSSMRPYALPWQRLRPALWPAVVAQSLRSPAAREARILELTLGPQRREPARLARWIAWQREYPVTLSNVHAQLLAAARYRYPDGAVPHCPCLLLCGAHDRVADPVCSQRLARAWNGHLEVHPEGGHDLPIDAPEWTAAHIVRWLHEAVWR